jgi:hypothetical protein
VKDQDRNKAWGFSLFCDDARSEVGGKTSLMGLYQSDMFFPDNVPLPVMVPKFIIQIMYYEIIGSIEHDISFKVTLGSKDEAIAEIPILRKDIVAPLAAENLKNGLAEEEERIFHLRMPLVLSPFHISEMGRLRVRAHYGDGAILKLGSLALRQVSEAEFRGMLGIPPQ